MERESFVLSQSVFAVYLKLQLLSRLDEAEKRYHDIISRKR